MRKHSPRGFTLIELLVVLAVIAIVTSISFGAFKSVSEGNKRTSCQSNMQQLYKSLRLYGQDYDGQLPYLNENGDPDMKTAATSPYNNVVQTPRGGIGLWSLYTYAKVGNPRPSNVLPTDSTNCSSSSVDLPAQLEDNSQADFVGLAGYIRNPKIFHCPADNFAHDVQYRDLTDTSNPTYECKTTNVNSPTLLIKDGDYNYFNPSYLSYQVVDDNPKDVPTYASFRKPEGTIKYRQITPFKIDTSSGGTRLVDRSIKDMTVLTWCRFHRSLNTDSTTKSSKRAIDNVLFSDGSVQSIPVEQPVTQTQTGVTGTCLGWQRVPREKADSMSKDYPISDCVPSP